MYLFLMPTISIDDRCEVNKKEFGTTILRHMQHHLIPIAQKYFFPFKLAPPDHCFD